MACLEGSHREVKAECRQRKKLRHIPSLGSTGRYRVLLLDFD